MGCFLRLASVQFSHSVASDSLWPYGLQHARLLCPSPSPRVCSNSCPLNQWCHPTISFSVAPFSSWTQSFSTSRSFPVNQLFISGGQSIGASTSVFPMRIQGWFPLGLTGLISLLFKRPPRVLKVPSILQYSAFFMVQLSHSYIAIEKTSEGIYLPSINVLDWGEHSLLVSM